MTAGQLGELGTKPFARDASRPLRIDNEVVGAQHIGGSDNGMRIQRVGHAVGQKRLRPKLGDGRLGRRLVAVAEQMSPSGLVVHPGTAISLDAPSPTE